MPTNLPPIPWPSHLVMAFAMWRLRGVPGLARYIRRDLVASLQWRLAGLLLELVSYTAWLPHCLSITSFTVRTAVALTKAGQLRRGLATSNVRQKLI